MSVADVSSSIEIGVDVMTTLTTEKLALGTPVATIGESARIAPLRGVAGIYRDDTAATRLGLVLQEGLELPEAPLMQAALAFPSGGLDAPADVREVLNDNCGSWINTINNAFAQNVVAIPPEPRSAAREASQVALGRLGAVGLQPATQPEGALIYFAPVTPSVELVVRGDGGVCDPKVNADCLRVVLEWHIGEVDDDVQIPAPAFEHEVSRSSRQPGSVGSILGDGEGHLLPPRSRCYADETLLPIDFEGAAVVTGRRGSRMWLTDFAPLAFKNEGSGYCFCGLLNGLDEEVCAEVGLRLPTGVVDDMVQCVGVSLSQSPTFGADMIECDSELAYGFTQGLTLRVGRADGNTHSSLHSSIIP